MITLKFRYSSDEETSKLIKELRRQQSIVYRVSFNYICKHPEITKFSLEKKDSELNVILSKLRNIDDIDFILKQSAIDAAYQSARANYTDKKYKTIFGGKKNFIKRCKGIITNEEYKELKTNNLYVIGRSNLTGGNQKFKLQNDLSTIKFKNYELKLIGVHNRQDILKRLYVCTLEHKLPITYKLDLEYVYICFDESLLYAKDFKVNALEGRVMAIDMNPNYVGWSIVDWKSSSEFNIIKSGVFSIKQLNDKEYNFKKQNLASNSKQRIWLSNKRRVETLEISKALVNIALHYRCQLFIVEELNIKPSDKGIGKNFNRLCNNNWNRNVLINNLRKRCNIFGIKLLEVKPEYSSFIGNFIFRSVDTKLPDMVLASIEIGRRGFEFYGQYISKKLKIQKNIVQPNRNDFKRLIDKSLEEFALKDKDHLSLVELYYHFKNSKILYRVSLDLLGLKFYRLKSRKSFIRFEQF